MDNHNYTTQAARFPSYGPFYNALRSHHNVDKFMHGFHGVGCGTWKDWYTKEHQIIRSIYSFWRERGFVTRKQINLATHILNQLGEY